MNQASPAVRPRNQYSGRNRCSRWFFCTTSPSLLNPSACIKQHARACATLPGPGSRRECGCRSSRSPCRQDAACRRPSQPLENNREGTSCWHRFLLNFLPRKLWRCVSSIIHTRVFVRVALLAHGGALVGVGLGRTGSAVGRAHFGAVRSRFAVETLGRVRHP